jgi:hypothetical protein
MKEFFFRKGREGRCADQSAFLKHLGVHKKQLKSAQLIFTPRC